MAKTRSTTTGQIEDDSVESPAELHPGRTAVTMRGMTNWKGRVLKYGEDVWVATEDAERWIANGAAVACPNPSKSAAVQRLRGGP